MTSIEARPPVACAVCGVVPATLQPVIVTRAVAGGAKANLIPQLGICDGHPTVTHADLLPLGMWDAVQEALATVAGGPVDDTLTEIVTQPLGSEIIFEDDRKE